MVERGKITPEAGSGNVIILPIDDGNYPEFLKENGLAVLVLAESWCPHCKDYESIVSQLAQALPEVRFGLAFLDKPFHAEPYWRNQKGIRINSIPTTLMFKEGEAIALLRGSYPFEDVKEILEKYLIQGQLIPRNELVEAFRENLPPRETSSLSPEQIAALIEDLDNALGNARKRKEDKSPPPKNGKPNLLIRVFNVLRS